MKTVDSLRKIWVGAGGATYAEYPFEFSSHAPEGLDWLVPLDPATADEMEPHRQDSEGRSLLKSNLEKIRLEAKALRIVWPASFLELMESDELRDRIPSCTACYFDLPEAFMPSPFQAGEFLLRFLNDQQGCCYWYLYFPGDGEASVVCSWGLEHNPELEDPDGPISAEVREKIRESTAFVATTFEDFIYRFWRENIDWFEEHKKENRPATPTQPKPRKSTLFSWIKRRLGR